MDVRTRQQLETLSRAVEALLRRAEEEADWADQMAFRTLRSQLEQLRTGEDPQPERKYQHDE